jgi:hypothetical protein
MKRLAMMLILSTSAWPLWGVAADAEAPVSASASHSSTNGGLDLRALIREVAAREHKRVVWDPRLPQQIDIAGARAADANYAIRAVARALMPGSGGVDRLASSFPASDGRNLPAKRIFCAELTSRS